MGTLGGRGAGRIEDEMDSSRQGGQAAAQAHFSVQMRCTHPGEQRWKCRTLPGRGRSSVSPT